MAVIQVPYGKNHIEIKTDNVREILVSKLNTTPVSEEPNSIVEKALKSPIESERLCVLASKAKTCTIIVSDHTRPVPSKYIVPHILKELRKGNPFIKIKLLVATGCHRGTTKEELVFKLGEDVVTNEEIVIHDCDNSPVVNLGVLPSGAELIINKEAVDCDLLISEGFIEPHFFAGYSGGRKSILPGICSRKTVLGNHCSEFIDSPDAVAGSLDKNPINKDMEAAAVMAKLAFIVNVVINEDKTIMAAFAGSPIKAHRTGCAYLDSLCRVIPKGKSSIVITSNGGYPLDQNVYQSVKGMSAGARVVADGGVIIMCSLCNDGNGGLSFYKALSECASVTELLTQIRQTPMDKTIPDQWEYQILAKIIEKYTVIMVCTSEMKKEIEDMKMHWAGSINEAIALAEKITGKKDITVIPNGVSVII